MGRQEIKSEIQKILSKLSDENLMAILDYLREVQQLDDSKLTISKNLGIILMEDATLLKRLAQ